MSREYTVCRRCGAHKLLGVACRFCRPIAAATDGKRFLRAMHRCRKSQNTKELEQDLSAYAVPQPIATAIRKLSAETRPTEVIKQT